MEDEAFHLFSGRVEMGFSLLILRAHHLYAEYLSFLQSILSQKKEKRKVVFFFCFLECQDDAEEKGKRRTVVHAVKAGVTVGQHRSSSTGLVG